MAMTPEAKVKKAVKKILDSLGAYYFSPQSGIYGRSGVPDIVGCYKGCFFAIECKANGGVPTALQLKEIQKIKDAGGAAFVVDEHNIDDVYLLTLLGE